MSDVIGKAAIPFTARGMAAGFQRYLTFLKLKFGGFDEYHYLCSDKKKNIMEATTIYPVRTREEILAWLDAARQRKAAWKKHVTAQWEERERRRKEAAESGYYNIEWA